MFSRVLKDAAASKGLYNGYRQESRSKCHLRIFFLLHKDQQVSDLTEVEPLGPPGKQKKHTHKIAHIAHRWPLAFVFRPKEAKAPSCEDP